MLRGLGIPHGDAAEGGTPRATAHLVSIVGPLVAQTGVTNCRYDESCQKDPCVRITSVGLL